jgi:hypothetical protein
MPVQAGIPHREEDKVMRTRTTVRTALAGLALGGGLAWAQGAPLQTQETNTAGVAAELTECRRSEGVLSIRVRFRNTSEAKVSFYAIDGRNYDSYYVVAAGKKHFVLRDSEKTPLAPAATPGGSLGVELPKGGSFLWWAKYPAPPADVKKITYVTPLGAPFENVPISDQ